MDSRHRRRPDSRQMWDESDRRDRDPPRDRDRDRDRDRHRDRDRDRRRDRRPYRSRSRERRRSRSPNQRRRTSRDRRDDNRRPKRDDEHPSTLPTRPRADIREPPPRKDQDVPMAQDKPNDEDVDDDEAAMQAMLGFGGFGSTKGKKVAGNNVGGVRKEKKTEYRQYMNRQGGFNRPLSPSR